VTDSSFGVRFQGALSNQGSLLSSSTDTNTGSRARVMAKQGVFDGLNGRRALNTEFKKEDLLYTKKARIVVTHSLLMVLYNNHSHLNKLIKPSTPAMKKVNISTHRVAMPRKIRPSNITRCVK
jgi:hypothetical protein